MTRHALRPQITIAAAAEVCGLSTRRLLQLSAAPPLCHARSKGHGRNARVTLDRDAFARWMDSRRAVQPAGSAS